MAIFNLCLYFSTEFVKNGYPRIVQKFIYKFSEKRKCKLDFVIRVGDKTKVLIYGMGFENPCVFFFESSLQWVGRECTISSELRRNDTEYTCWFLDRNVSIIFVFLNGGFSHDFPNMKIHLKVTHKEEMVFKNYSLHGTYFF